MTSASGTLSQYLQYSNHMFKTAQGMLLASALSLRDEHVLNRNLWDIDIRRFVMGNCMQPLDAIVSSHLLSVQATNAADHVMAYKYQTACISTIVRLLKSEKHTKSWMVPVLHSACIDLRIAAQRVDSALNTGGVLEKAVESLTTCFKVCSDENFPSDEYSKKKGVLYGLEDDMKIYLRLDKLDVCESMISSIQPTVLEPDCSPSHRVAYKFHQGRLSVLEADFIAADKQFGYAFKHCNEVDYHMKRLILAYLLPVKMVLGSIPTKELTEKYDLPVMWDLLTSVKEADMESFKAITDANSQFFEDAGLTSAIESLQVLTQERTYKEPRYIYKMPAACLQGSMQVLSLGDPEAPEGHCLVQGLFEYDEMTLLNAEVYF